MSKELGLIHLTVNYIKNDDLIRLDKALRVMPLEKLKDKHQQLLFTFLALSANYDREKAAKMILERWKVIYPEQDKISIIPRLFLMRNINISTLSWIIKIHPNHTFVDIMDDLSQWDNSPSIVTATARADEIFGQQPLTTYKLIRDHAASLDNYKVEEYMKEKIKEVSPYAPKPQYIKNYSQNDLKSEEELYKIAAEESIKDIIVKDMSDEKAVELLTEGMKDYGISVSEMDQAKIFLLDKIKTMSLVERNELLKPVIQNKEELELDSDELLFQTFGPAHPLVDQDLTDDNISSKYGGCRMFLCDLFDYDYDFDYVADWFTGSCDQCLSRIKHRWYALRRPRNLGGWEGCYCNFNCIRDSLLTDGLEPALLQRDLINKFEKRIQKIGIQDRT